MVNRLKKYLNFSEAIYIVFGIYVLTILIPEITISILQPAFNNIIKVVRYGCYIFFVGKIFFDWKNQRTKITLSAILITIFLFIVYLISKNKPIIILMLVLLALRNTKLDKLIKVALSSYVIVFSIVMIGVLFHYIPDWIYTRDGISRHSLGFSYPTVTMGYYLMIIFMYTYIRKNKITFWEILLLETIAIFLYQCTAGRTGFILITAVLIVSLLRKSKSFRRFFKTEFMQTNLKVCCYIMPMILFISIVIITSLYGMNNKFAHNINNFLNTRIQLGYQAIQTYGITAFGKEIQWNGWGGYGYIEDIDTENYVYNYVDNGYLRIMLDYGIIMIILVIIGYTIILVKNYNDKNYWITFIIFMILILAEIEPCLLDLNRNIFVILLLPLLEYKEIKKLNYENIVKRI